MYATEYIFRRHPAVRPAIVLPLRHANAVLARSGIGAPSYESPAMAAGAAGLFGGGRMKRSHRPASWWVSIGTAFAVAVFWLAVPPELAFAQEKTLRGVALVIGNGDYEQLAKLPNPENDARAIEEMLDGLGFDTTVTMDRNARRLRRDIEGFVEDAEGADVAVVYYSGHGIEAGGENFLIPVDADLSALDDAGGKLVPMSDLLSELKASVPVTIVLLDACRDNPFPPGSVLKRDSGDPGTAISVGGLGETRGAVPLSASAAADASLGQVIGFAAEPGKVALDGEAGGNSPYAAALLRHLSAINGEEFGTVLRMVAEEVYLKTGGRQRPWVNESLRRLLYFGQPATEPAGDEGDILTERRRLLVTIAALPEPGRKRIEAIAGADGVPMDALYGMLAALGAEAPSNPDDLDRLLRGQTERLKTMLAERDALKSQDTEIVRLAALSDQALGEGALTTAIRLLGEAKARVRELDEAVDQAEEDIARKRIEFAAIYAKSAETRALAFDYLGAADDYALAFEQVGKWDERLAWSYKNGEADALTQHGNFKGDKDALVRAVTAGEDAARLARDFPDRSDWTRSQILYGNALQTLGDREADPHHLEQSIAAYRATLDVLTPETEPVDWATVQNNIANTLAMLGRRQGNAETLAEATEAYRLAIGQYEANGARAEWAFAMNNLGKVLYERGEMVAGVDLLNEAGRTFESALTEVSRPAAPMLWATIQNNLGNVLQALGNRAADGNVGAGRQLQAVVAYRAALLEWTPERAPSQRAVAQNNLANTYQSLAYRDAGRAMEHLRAAEAAQTEALDTTARAAAPLQWAAFSYNRARTRHMMGDHAGDPAEVRRLYAASAADFGNALGEMTRERVPGQWAQAQNALGYVLQALAGKEETDAAALAALRRSEAALRAVLDYHTAAQFPAERANTLQTLGTTLVLAGDRGGGIDGYRAAEAAYREALSLRSREASPVEWAYAQAGIGNALRAIGLATGERATLEEAKTLTQQAWDTIRPIDGQFDGLLAGRIAEIDAALVKLN